MVTFHDSDINLYEYEPFDFEYKDHRFHFEAGAIKDFERLSPYLATMTEPDGTQWRCTYDYGYCAGFPEDELDEQGYYIPYKDADHD